MIIYHHENMHYEMILLVEVHFMSSFVKIANITDENCTYEKYIFNSTLQQHINKN